MANGSTLPRRALGRRMRDLRAAAGKSQLAAGLAIEVSKQGIGRLEDGHVVRISTAQFRDLLDFYAADVEAKAEVFGLLQEIRAATGDSASGWWRAYSDVVNPHFDHYMSLEQACSKMSAFVLTLLPGLLQTSDYRRAVVAVNDPDLPKVDVERRLELTARRQQRLTDDPDFTVDIMLSESALRHQVGGREVMARELRHLADLGTLPNVSLRAIPFDVGMHPGLVVQSFTYFEFPPLRTGRTPEPPVVFVEGFTGALFLEDADVVTPYAATADALHQVALSGDDSRRLIHRIAEEYARG